MQELIPEQIQMNRFTNEKTQKRLVCGTSNVVFLSSFTMKYPGRAQQEI
jgi:hypothetical protein